MAETNPFLSDANVKEILGEALLRTLDANARDVLIKGALVHLLTPTRSAGYSGYEQPAPIVAAFNEAARTVAAQIVRERLAGDAEFRTKVDGLLNDVVAKVFGEKREKIVEATADLLGQAISKLARDY